MKFASHALGLLLLIFVLSPKKVQANAVTGFWTSLNTLPVVVHVMHAGTPLGAPDNPSDSLIQEMIDLMNAAFQKDGPLYGGADIGFAFQLANRSPNCDITSGINRIDASEVPDYVTGGITTDTNFFPNSAHEVFVKALSRWPNTDYINIWVVNKIDNNEFWPGGFAYFPEYNSARTDGIVVRASNVNGINKTIIHELGHYFNLFHVNEDEDWETLCSVNADCNTDGDRVCDTEPCVFISNCNELQNSCTQEDWLIADAMQDYTVLNNHMGFTDCQWMFTEGQKSRMQNALVSFRPGLLSSMAISSMAEVIPESACIPTAINGLSFFYGIERVEFGTLDVYSNTSHGDAAHYLDRTCNQRTWIEAGDSVVIRVTGSYENPVQVRVYLDMNDDGSFGLSELILFGLDGIVEDTIEIPVLGISLCIPLRLRVVVDLPLAPDPSPCLLTGTLAEGVGQIEDYAVVITPRNVESVDSGDWDDPGAWSCNCVPGASDAVAINSGHVIDVFPEMGIIECVEIELVPGAILNLDGEIRVTGGCLKTFVQKRSSNSGIDPLRKCHSGHISWLKKLQTSAGLPASASLE